MTARSSRHPSPEIICVACAPCHVCTQHRRAKLLVEPGAGLDRISDFAIVYNTGPLLGMSLVLTCLLRFDSQNDTFVSDHLMLKNACKRSAAAKNKMGYDTYLNQSRTCPI